VNLLDKQIPVNITSTKEEPVKEFYPEDLLEYDGKDGKPVYVAHEGKVYDVGGSKLWKGGQHMRRHQAGKDLTTDIQAAPHQPDVLERHPQVGVLKKREEAVEKSGLPLLDDLLRRYPMLRRHPHPMTVHFPIVFMVAAPVFTVLYLLTGNQSFETTAFHCLGAGLLFTPVAMLTGLLSWRLNYLAKPMPQIEIKKQASVGMLILAAVAFFWRLNAPGMLLHLTPASIAYMLLVLPLAPLVGIIGWFGASLTFPLEKE
jgi:predicted heme/steroid binding protein/uncharacterized membrane protein